MFVALCVVGLVLVQQGKGASLGAAFGSGASQTIFGARGSGSFLFRLTIGLISVFFITSITLNYMSTREFKRSQMMTMPAAPLVPINSKQQPKTPVPMTAPESSTPPKTAPIPAVPEAPAGPKSKTTPITPGKPGEVPVRK